MRWGTARIPKNLRLLLIVLVALAVGLLVACGGEEEAPEGAEQAEAPAPAPGWTDEDWEAFSSRIRQGLDEGWDTLPMNAAMAELGRTFVGTAYVPGTLDPEGPEKLVINFEGLDCVTFVENVYSMVRFVRQPNASDLLASRGEAEDRYEDLLSDIRYREGFVDGYTSRLHYFSDWIGTNAERGLLRPITQDLGGVTDEEPIDFMTTHPEAYRQLADSANLEEIRATEERLSSVPRWYIPEDRVADVADRIESGDIIAATSTVSGLDIAHTGLALWVDGELRLMHAPLVGEDVQISERPLAERLQGIDGQDGIMVARPLSPGDS